jgi:predicted PurR-regulated permease PerM
VFENKAFVSQLFLFGIIAVLALLWAASEILIPFFIAFLLAYLLHPSVDALTARGLPRPIVSGFLVFALVAVVILLAVWLGPLLYDQMNGFLQGARSMVVDVTTTIRKALTPYLPALRQVGLGGLVTAKEPMGDLTGPLAATLVTGGMTVIENFGLALLTPLITFYVLTDWNRMTVVLISEVPKEHRPWVRELATEIDETLASFLRGQTWVCTSVAILYTIGLMSVGLNYGLLIGLVSGALKYLPYVGTAIGLTIAISFAIAQSGLDSLLLVWVLLVYGVVEFIESAIISPKLIGRSVHLPPAVVIFVVLVGGQLFGVVGVFVAIPLFAVIRVAASFWRRRREAATQDAIIASRERRATASPRVSNIKP